MGINEINIKLTKSIKRYDTTSWATIICHNDSNVDIKKIDISYQIINKKGITETKSTDTTSDLSAGEKREVLNKSLYTNIGQCKLIISKVNIKAADGSAFDVPPPPEFDFCKSPCFVTTVVYGDPQHPTVETYRRFRDQILINYSAGRKFNKWYETYGPIIALKIKNNQFIKSIIRIVLTPIANLINRIFFNKS